MPELPEVETLRRALLPIILNKKLLQLKFYRPDLRFPIPKETLEENMSNSKIKDITRVGKYLLIHNDEGAMGWHLGMSGRVIQRDSLKPLEKHTHAAFKFSPSTFLHFVDPRRFGSIFWVDKDKGHSLINHLGPDPLSPNTTATILKEAAKKCKGPIKGFLMNANRLAGIGNIYACETLFSISMNPKKPAYRLTLPDWEKLLDALRTTLKKSIAAGGTTLKDFFSTDGAPGYFALNLSVYGKEGKPCPRCQSPICRKVHSGRSTFYCKICQKR